MRAHVGPLSDTPAVVRIRDKGETVVDDQTWPIAQLLQVHADMHLPGRLSQPEELRS